MTDNIMANITRPNQIKVDNRILAPNNCSC